MNALPDLHPTTFEAFSQLGFCRLVPILPPDAQISEKSSLFKRVGTNQDPRGKAPGIRHRDGRWSSYDWLAKDATLDDLSRWQEMGAGIGLRMGAGIGAIDADAYDNESAAVIRNLVKSRLGMLPTRVGQFPKTAYLFALSEPLPYTRIEFGPLNEKGQLRDRVEVLGEGRQMVAHGIHPKTGQPYNWTKPIVPRDQLPKFAPSQIIAFLEELRSLLPAAKPLISEGATTEISQSSLKGSLESVRKAVQATPNNSKLFGTREAYRDYGYAIRAALPDNEPEAFEIFSEWCARWEDGANDPDIVAADWRRMKPPYRRGANWLYELAEQHAPEKFKKVDAFFDALPDEPESLFAAPTTSLVCEVEPLICIDPTTWAGRQPDNAVAGKFVQADEGNIVEFRNLMREAGNDAGTVAAVRDQILADVRDRGLLDRPDQLGEYLGRYSTILSDPRFANVRQGLDNAAGLRRSLDEATTRETNLTRELGTPDQPGTSTVGKYLAYGDERSQDALKSIMSAKKPGEAMGEALDFVNNAPAAVEGARKSFWDLMQSRARSNGETTKTIDGKQPWMPNRLKNFLDDPATQAVAERLYRDNPEHIGNVRQIAAELQHVDLRARGKANNTSGTAQSVSNVLTPETLQSRFYAYKRGQTSLGFMLTALGSVAARRLVRGAQGEAMEKLLDKALLDPDLAAQLLKEHNPANRAALARSAKAYLGNEASTLTDILDGQEKDPVKDAIMRK